MGEPHGVEIVGELGDRYGEVLDRTSLGLLAELQRSFAKRRAELLARRRERQSAFDSGELPSLGEETREVREAPWQVPFPAPGLVNRRVEITGPTDAKTVINALNSGAQVFMADFEDAASPSWENMLEGQINLKDAVAGTLSFTTTEQKSYELGDDLATLTVRPRGWHLEEKHLLVDAEPVSASLFDFALYIASCGRPQLESGLGPYVYLPKIESHLEARLWDEAITLAEDYLGLERGSVRATVLIETLPAAFEMHEILYELRDHSAGLNAGRWDYLFSIIKKLRKLGMDYVLPDRNSVTMSAPFMAGYCEALVAACHARGAHAIGGMAAFIPSRSDPEANAAAIYKVRADKEREAALGFDGSWVAHPGLVGVCSSVFTSVLGSAPNQLGKLFSGVTPDPARLLDISSAGNEATAEGLRNDINVALQYMSAWLSGTGAVAIHSLMEDAATAEIARSQVWQWIHNAVVLADGRTVTRKLVAEVLDGEMGKLAGGAAVAVARSRLDDARVLFERAALENELPEFFTELAYRSMP